MARKNLFKSRRMRKLEKKGYMTPKAREKQENRDVSVARSLFETSKSLPFFCILVVISIYLLSSFVHKHYVFSYNFVVGQEAPYNIYAEENFEYVDADYTKLLKKEVADMTPPVFRMEQASIDLSRRLFLLLFKDQSKHYNIQAFRSFAEENKITLPDNFTFEDLQSLSFIGSLKDKREYLKEIFNTVILGGIAQKEDISVFRRYNRICLEDELSRRTFSSISKIKTPSDAAIDIIRAYTKKFNINKLSAALALEKILPEIIMTNIVYDIKKTKAARKKATSKVKSVKKTFPAKRLLIEKGQRITVSDLNKLKSYEEALSVKGHQVDITKILVFFFLSLLILSVFAFYFYRVYPGFYHQNSLVLLTTIVVSANIIFNRFLLEIYRFATEYVMFDWQSNYYSFPILMLALSPMLLTILIDLRIAIIVGFFMSVITAMQNSFSFELLVLGMLSGMIGSVLINNVRNRKQIFSASMGACTTIFLLVEILFFNSHMPPKSYLIIMMFCLGNGLLLFTLIMLLLPPLEYFFGITTNISLLELSDLNHPLLQRMQMEAPGTYHHSLMVATLAEQTAREIGANPLLTRVCSYFHDIGKLANPSYFTENIHGENKHDELNPRMSTLVILNHVKEGLLLASKYKLQKPIRDVIKQHHGTSLVYYFYNKAKKEQELDQSEKKEKLETRTNIIGDEFRYPGPTPHTKESVIISIADVCEAASRSLEKPTPKKIKKLVWKLISNKILDHQFDDADITLQELGIVKKRITKVLTDMLHTRIKYPENENASNNIQKKTKNSESGQK
ncbi:MAG: HDIG domain-containing protein [Verrucomicrobiota bacterium]|nr:HDIG domain-containing protein [Verrucomicrobiota bacterium]